MDSQRSLTDGANTHSLECVELTKNFIKEPEVIQEIFKKMPNIGSSNQIQLKSYKRNRVTRWNMDKNLHFINSDPSK